MSAVAIRLFRLTSGFQSVMPEAIRHPEVLFGILDPAFAAMTIENIGTVYRQAG
jgi:hypothetical protein